MTAVLLSAMFGSIAALALCAIATSWKCYGRRVLALRGQLADCATLQDVRFAVIEPRKRLMVRPRRLVFSAPVRRPLVQLVLRAAA